MSTSQLEKLLNSNFTPNTSRVDINTKGAPTQVIHLAKITEQVDIDNNVTNFPKFSCAIDTPMMTNPPSIISSIVDTQ